MHNFDLAVSAHAGKRKRGCVLSFFFALLQYDIEFKGDDFTEKKNLDMLSKSLRKEIHNLGITWSNSGKQTQCVCITRSYLLVKGRNGGRQTQRSCIEQSCLRLCYERCHVDRLCGLRLFRLLPFFFAGTQFLQWRDLHRGRMRTKMKARQASRLLHRLSLKRFMHR